MNSRLYRLLEAHQRIDGQLHLERQRRWKDWSRITQLKKLKLRVKDLIHRYTLRDGPGEQSARHVALERSFTGR